MIALKKIPNQIQAQIIFTFLGEYYEYYVSFMLKYKCTLMLFSRRVVDVVRSTENYLGKFFATKVIQGQSKFYVATYDEPLLQKW